MNIQKPAGAQFGDRFLDKKVEAKNKLRRVYAVSKTIILGPQFLFEVQIMDRVPPRVSTARES